MNFEEFKNVVIISMEDICRSISRERRSSIKIKSEEVAVKNLVLIFNATLELSNAKGFQAMSLRDLSEKTGLSLGALYAYFTSKDELLDIILQQGWLVTTNVLTGQIDPEMGPRERLRTAIRAHLYLSEMLQSWFFFSFMEAKNLGRSEIKKIIQAELFTEKIFTDILEDGVNKNVFAMRKEDITLTSSSIKAVLQDWYLKRWKFTRRDISIDEYVRFIVDSVEKLILPS